MSPMRYLVGCSSPPLMRLASQKKKLTRPHAWCKQCIPSRPGPARASCSPPSPRPARTFRKSGNPETEIFPPPSPRRCARAYHVRCLAFFSDRVKKGVYGYRYVFWSSAYRTSSSVHLQKKKKKRDQKTHDEKYQVEIKNRTVLRQKR